MNSRYFPIGTVVLLRGGSKKVMVIGYFGVDAEGTAVDYMGVMYPDGFMDANTIIGFDGSQVQEIIYEGYRDVEQNALFQQLDAFASGAVTSFQSDTVPYVQSKTVPVGSNEEDSNN